MRNKLINISLLFSSLFISLLFCEVVLRTISDDQFYIWPPNLEQYFLPDTTILPGIKDTSFFKINSLGFRGNEYNDSDVINIVTLGGSTTECLYLDQNETWPALLEKYLNQNSNKKYRVFNGGRSGLNSQHHVTQIQKLLENEKWIDLIIVLEGINDLQYALSLENNYKKKDSQTIYSESFLMAPLNNKLPFYKRSYLFMYLSKLKKAILSYALGQDLYGYSYLQWRKNRSNALKIVDTNPPLEHSLSDFKNNTVSIINMVRSKNKKIVFITQPVAWDFTMQNDQKKLCWLGWIGKDQNENIGSYYSFSQLKKSMDKYNSLLKTICAANNVDCIDLESKLEKNTTSFYDDCHFNESGADKVARLIFMFIKANT